METPEEEQRHIGARVKMYRDANGWTQSELADRAAVSRSFISQIETGKASVSLGAIIRIAKAFGLSLADLVGAENKLPAIPHFAFGELPTTEEGWRMLIAIWRIANMDRDE